MKITSLLNTILYTFVALFSSHEDTKLSLTKEVRNNCSLSDEIEVTTSKGYQTHYEPSVLEDCHLCGSLVKYLWPSMKTTGTHVIGHADEGTWQHRLGKLYRIAALYHEMGHIHHQDSLKSKMLSDNIKMSRVPLDKLVQLKKHDAYEYEQYTAFLEEENFAHDLRRVARYSERARQFFKSQKHQTVVAQYIARFLREDKPLWNSPLCPVCVQEKKYKRGKESRADLFAADKMWINGRIDVIVAILYLHASSEYKIAGPHDIHPSGIERALMFVGFLLEKEVDFNGLIAEFEKNPVEEVYENEKVYLLSQVKHELIAEHYDHTDGVAHSNSSCCVNDKHFS